MRTLKMLKLAQMPPNSTCVHARYQGMLQSRIIIRKLSPATAYLVDARTCADASEQQH